MVCCGNTTNINTLLEEETGFAVSDFDLRDGKKQRFLRFVFIVALSLGEFSDGPLCNGIICVYEDGSVYSDVP